MLVHQELVARHPNAWRKDGRSPEAEKAFTKAKAPLKLVTSGIKKQGKEESQEAVLISKTATVVLKDKQTQEHKKLVRFNDNNEHYSWPDLLQVTGLTKEDIMAKVMAYDEQPRDFDTHTHTWSSIMLSTIGAGPPKEGGQNANEGAPRD
eukprot:4842953-Amphidinium_carterae.8